MDSETGSFGESFQLMALGFEMLKWIGVPRGGVCEGDGFGWGMETILSRQEESKTSVTL